MIRSEIEIEITFPFIIASQCDTSALGRRCVRPLLGATVCCRERKTTDLSKWKMHHVPGLAGSAGSAVSGVVLPD